MEGSASFHMCIHCSCAQSHSCFTVKAAPWVSRREDCVWWVCLGLQLGSPCTFRAPGAAGCSVMPAWVPVPCPAPKAPRFLVNPKFSSSCVASTVFLPYFEYNHSFCQHTDSQEYRWAFGAGAGRMRLSGFHFASHLCPAQMREIGHLLCRMMNISGWCTAQCCCEPLHTPNINSKQNIQGP